VGIKELSVKGSAMHEARVSGQSASSSKIALFRAEPPLQGANESLGSFAYRALRDSLRAGRIPPGAHIRELDVAQWLKISRTPVREAFHRIVSEGLLVTGPWNGVMLIELEPKQLVDLYAVRETLEGTAASLAAKNATPAEIRALFDLAATEAKEKDYPSKLVVINAKLHQVIYRAAHNQFLLQSLTSVVDTLGLLRHSTFVLPGSVELAHAEHLEIIHAIRDGRAKRAEMLARQHIRHALAMRLQLHKARNSESTASYRGAKRDS
jgi:DNA-binding GntR family transcriptional regulator